jgi:hypothetical protein
MRGSQIALALGALGLSLAAAGCGSSSTSSVSAHSSAATPATAVTSAAASPRTTATPASGPTSSPVQSTAPASAGVVADCTGAPPHGLSVRPGSIALACADNGSGVEGMTWTSWSAGAAAGHGMFWDKLCTPSCADGTTGSYPVTVTLSVVKTSPQGPWFSRLAVTWEGAKPPGTVPGSYGLLAPGS